MEQDLEISVTQAAKMLNSAGRTIVNYCLAGKLTGQKNPVTGVWKISLASVNKLLKETKDDKTSN